MTSSSSNDGKVLFEKTPNNSSIDDVWDDSELIKMYEKATSKAYAKVQNAAMNQGDKASSSIPQQPIKKWKVGDVCMAPFEEDGKWYPATIETMVEAKDTCQVTFTGYETKATVKLSQICAEDDVAFVDDEEEDEQEATAEEENQQAMKLPASGITPALKTNGVANTACPSFPIPDHCPPPPPALFGKIVAAGTEKEALTNTLMAWYMAGYHTGFYQGMMQKKT